jgi:hypothetical protein
VVALRVQAPPGHMHDTVATQGQILTSWCKQNYPSHDRVQLQSVQLLAATVEFCQPGCDKLQLFQTSSEVVQRDMMLSAADSYGL